MTKILKLPEVTAMTGLSRSSVYDFVKKGAFPAPIPLGSRAVGWLESDIANWIEQRAAMRHA